MPKKLKKVPRNVNIEDKQWRQLKRLGLTNNFSHNIRRFIELGLLMLKYRVIKDLSADSLKKVREELVDEKTRSAVEKLKVTEYKDIYEELTKMTRYKLPDISKFPNMIFRLNEIFFDYSFRKYKDDPVFHKIIEKVGKRSKILKDVKMFYDNPKDKYPSIELTSEHPYSLLHYIKEVLLILSRSDYHWTVDRTTPEEFFPMENMRRIKISFKNSDSADQAIQKIVEIFCNLKLKLKDPENIGIWDDLNTPHYFIMDKECLNYFIEGRKEIPFEKIIKSIETLSQNDTDKSYYLFRFYEKLHLISDLENSPEEVRFIDIKPPFITKILEKTLSYMGIENELKMNNALATFTLKIHSS